MFKRFFSLKTWYRQDLAGIASIEFPHKPHEKSTDGITQIGLLSQPNYFLVDIEDLSNYPGLQVGKDELQNLYSGIQKGYFQNAKYELVNTSTFFVGLFSGLQNDYITASGEQPSIRVKRDIFIKNKVISIQFWTNSPSNSAAEEDRAYFFASLQINLEVSKVKQYTIE